LDPSIFGRQRKKRKKLWKFVDDEEGSIIEGVVQSMVAVDIVHGR